jgi:membrane protease YdiL (CAAX protease family)
MSTTSSPTSSEPLHAPRATVALLAWLAIVTLQVGLAYYARFVLEQSDAKDALYRYETAFGGGFVYVVLVALTFAIARLLVDWRGALALRPFALRWLWAALGVVVLAAVATVAIQILSGVSAGDEQAALPDRWRPDRIGAVAANAVVIAGLAPFAEELFFRGLGVRVLGILGTMGAVLASGLAFGLAHGLVVGLLPLVLFGVGLGWVRVRATSVWPGFVAHALYNGVVLTLGLYCAANPDLCLEAAFL